MFGSLTATQRPPFSWFLIVVLTLRLHLVGSSFNYVDYPRNYFQQKSQTISPPDFRVGIPCSDEDKVRIAKDFVQLNYDSTHCPVEEWLHQMATHDIPGSKFMVNIGINKGYTIAKWLNVFTPWNQVTTGKWQEYLLEVRPELEESCGPCNECQHTFPGQGFQRFLNIPHMTILAIDVNPHEITTVESIMRNIESAANVQHIGVSMFTAINAVGEKIGDWHIPACFVMEDDCGTVKHKDIIESNHMTYTLVDTVTFDHLFSEFKMSYRKFLKNRGYIFQDLTNTTFYPDVIDQKDRLRNSFPRIDLMAIDMDGYDALTIQGAYGQLAGRNIRSIMFEYHYLPPWRNMKLEEIVDKLDGYGYDCYIKGINRLWKLSSCFVNPFEFHNRGNMMCILRGDIWHDIVQPYVQE
jgi:hypothetical protein